MDYIEGLLSRADPESQMAATHTIEYRIFRPKLRSTADSLLRVRSLDHLRSLEQLWAPWRPAVEVLDELFGSVATTVWSRYPSIKSGGSPVVNSAGCAFHYAYSFMYQPASQRYEDLVLEFSAGHSDLAAAHLLPHQRLETAAYQMSRGTGELLTPRLGPIRLPGRGTVAFYDAVTDVAHRSVSHTWQHIDEILPVLATSYDVGSNDE